MEMSCNILTSLDDSHFRIDLHKDLSDIGQYLDLDAYDNRLHVAWMLRNTKLTNRGIVLTLLDMDRPRYADDMMGQSNTIAIHFAVLRMLWIRTHMWLTLYPLVYPTP